MAKLSLDEITFFAEQFPEITGVFGFEFGDDTFEAYRYNATFFAPTVGELTEHEYADGRKVILYVTSLDEGKNRAEKIAVALDIPVAIINGDDVKTAFDAYTKGTRTDG